MYLCQIHKPVDPGLPVVRLARILFSYSDDERVAKSEMRNQGTPLARHGAVMDAQAVLYLQLFMRGRERCTPLMSLIFQDCASSGLVKNTHCPQVPRARHLWTSVLLAMAPKVWMHEPDIPGFRVVRIGEKQSLSTDAAREAPVDKRAPRHGA